MGWSVGILMGCGIWMPMEYFSSSMLYDLHWYHWCWMKPIQSPLWGHCFLFLWLLCRSTTRGAPSAASFKLIWCWRRKPPEVAEAREKETIWVSKTRGKKKLVTDQRLPVKVTSFILEVSRFFLDTNKSGKSLSESSRSDFGLSSSWPAKSETSAVQVVVDQTTNQKCISLYRYQLWVYLIVLDWY